MKASVLNLSCEALAEFRQNIDNTLALAVNRMKEKQIRQATVTGKINILLKQTPDANGVILNMMELEPEVSLNLTAKAKIQCSKENGLFVRMDEEGRPIVGSFQIDIDELLEEMEMRAAGG